MIESNRECIKYESNFIRVCYAKRPGAQMGTGVVSEVHEKFSLFIPSLVIIDVRVEHLLRARGVVSVEL